MLRLEALSASAHAIRCTIADRRRDGVRLLAGRAVTPPLVLVPLAFGVADWSPYAGWAHPPTNADIGPLSNTEPSLKQQQRQRIAMQHGAHPRKGIYPYRDATDAFTLAADRGYTDIVDIMRGEEHRRTSKSPLAVVDEAVLVEMNAVLRRDDEDAMIAVFEAHPALVHTANSEGRTPLHWASACLWPRMAAWLLDHEADANVRATAGETPLDVVGYWRDDSSVDRVHLSTSVGEMLIARGAEPTARWAVAVGDAPWLRARHAEGALNNQSGLVTQAVKSNRPASSRCFWTWGSTLTNAGELAGSTKSCPRRASRCVSVRDWAGTTLRRFC